MRKRSRRPRQLIDEIPALRRLPAGQDLSLKAFGDVVVPGRGATAGIEEPEIRVADDGDARLGFEVHPIDVLAEVEFAEDGGGRTGVRGEVGVEEAHVEFATEEVCRVPRRPGAAELVDTGGVSTPTVVGVAEWRYGDGSKPRGGGRRARPLRQRSQALSAVAARSDDVRLVIEDEQVLWRGVFSGGRLLEHLDRAHVEEPFPEHFVHRQKRGGHAAAAGQELPSADPQLFGGHVGELLDAELDVLLLLRLGMGHVLAVRHHSRRNRGLEGLCFGWRASGELLIAEPRIFLARTWRPLGS